MYDCSRCVPLALTVTVTNNVKPHPRSCRWLWRRSERVSPVPLAATRRLRVGLSQMRCPPLSLGNTPNTRPIRTDKLSIGVQRKIFPGVRLLALQCLLGWPRLHPVAEMQRSGATALRQQWCVHGCRCRLQNRFPLTTCISLTLAPQLLAPLCRATIYFLPPASPAINARPAYNRRSCLPPFLVETHAAPLLIQGAPATFLSLKAKVKMGRSAACKQTRLDAMHAIRVPWLLPVVAFFPDQTCNERNLNGLQVKEQRRRRA